VNELHEVIRNSPVIVHQKRYAVARLRAVDPAARHFAVFTDAHETTVVTTEAELPHRDIEKVEKPFALLEFRVTVPFQAPGFLAAICGALAERWINVLVYSTFSRDYVLVPWADVEASVAALRAIGFKCERA
jgi:hypothetical protein